MRYQIPAGILALAMLAAPVAAQPSAEQLAGHYYLSGVMETGSELLLRPDGSFEWGVAYGSVDASATGRWAVEGETLRLTARQPDSGSVRYQLGEQRPWSERTTRALERRREREAVEARAARCPLPALAEEIVPDFGLMTTDAPLPPAEQVARAEAAARQARDAAQATLDRLRQTPDWPANEALVRQSDAAIRAFHSRQSTVQGLHEANGTHAPEPAPLVLPPECQLADAESQARAFHGVAIQVFDPNRYLRGGRYPHRGTL